jgi:hypothetical protein
MTRYRTKTTTLKNGTKVTTVTSGESEWQMQAASVRALRAMPEFGRRFILAADMAAGRRGRQTATIAKATGLVPGFPDLRLYLEGGRLGLIEYKTDKGRLSPAQRDMHAELTRLGFGYLAVVKATSGADCAEQTISLVRGWLAANDNQKQEG